jgi:histidine triad (HIT) family protein
MNLAPPPLMNVASCPFCRIINGDLSAEVLFRDDALICFLDAHPITPVHLLIVPLEHIESLNTVTPTHQDLLGHMLLTARHLAAENGLMESGYRLVINSGADAGQSVFHLHLHLIGGRPMPFRFEPK